MIQIRDLTFRYGRSAPLFDQLHLSLEAGNIYGLLGKNGAGKSTLMKIMAGLLFPQQGTVETMGFRPQERLPQFLQDTYFISEEFYLPSFVMEKFVDIYGPFYPRFSQELFGNYLEEFQLAKNQKLTSLSYGQKKKFLLAFGLATDSKLLILDEPTNGLDIPSKSQFRKVMANAIHEERSFVVSTHQVRDMENLIDPIIILDEGRIVFQETNEQISKRLSVKRLKGSEDKSKWLYHESSALGDYTVVTENTNGEETRMNLELLFNAVIGNKEGINRLFKHS